jgi:hypothetical protein
MSAKENPAALVDDQSLVFECNGLWKAPGVMRLTKEILVRGAVLMTDALLVPSEDRRVSDLLFGVLSRSSSPKILAPIHCSYADRAA